MYSIMNGKADNVVKFCLRIANLIKLRREKLILIKFNVLCIVNFELENSYSD